MPSLKRSAVASSTSEPVGRRHVRLPWREWHWSLAALLLALPALSPAADAAHEDVIPGWQWHLVANRDGAPPYIRTIAQSPDGYLWIGSHYGVYRFDGVRFQAMPPSSEAPLQSSDVSTLLAGADGHVWAGHDWGGLSVLKGDTHDIVKEPYLATVPLLRANGAGTTWAVAANGKRIALARLTDGRWSIQAQAPMGYMMDATVGKDGSLWYIVDDRLAFISTSATVAHILPSSLPEATLAGDSAGQPWLITRERLTPLSLPPPSRINGALGQGIAKPAAVKVGAVVFDGTKDFWAIEDDALLRRYHIDEDGHTIRMTGSWRSPYQLSNPSYGLRQVPMLVDREHNLWIGASQGLLRFSRASFTLVAGATAASSNWTIPYGALTDARGDVWTWRRGEVSRMAPNGSAVKYPITASAMDFTPCPAASGGVWMPRDAHTLVLVGGPAKRTIRLTGKNPLAGLMPGDCAEDSRGRLWADGSGGLRLLGPGGQTMVSLGEDSGYQVMNMVALDHGQMVAYVGHGSLWRSDGTHAVKLWDEKAVTLGGIEVMVRADGGLLLGGDRGIARYDGHRFITLSSQRFPYLAATTGIAQTPQGETWLQTSHGVVRLSTADMRHAFDDPRFPLKPQIFTMDDGLPGAATFFNLSNVNADRYGHIWFTTDNGIARHDAQQRWNLAPPPVIITGVEVGNEHRSVSRRLTLPPGAGRIRIDFTALSFADPARVQFRYRMQGIDTDWIDPGTERSASYTHLPPGTYTFQVIASNNEGVWNRTGATIELVEPALFYQTCWFRGLLAAIAMLAVWAGYRWRLGVVAGRLREHAAQRAQERERVARDIHDTLLQSIQGLVLRFQSVAGKMPGNDPNRALLETTLDRADELIAQGKERVHGLRDDDRPLSLLDLIREQVDEAPFPLDVRRQINLSGAPVEVHSAVALEIREIVGEALFNAARHAEAGTISVEIVYGAKALAVAVNDDGVGMDRAAPSTSEGYGLFSMRGRAEGIGGALTITPGMAGGTRIALSVPARRAYVDRPFWWTRRSVR